MDTTVKDIYAELIRVRCLAYCPYSDHPVGIVVIDENGVLSSGCNVEAAHFKGLCGEASAISRMIAQGGRIIRDLYILGPPENPACPPCGDCRQRIREFADEHSRIHAFDKKGEIAWTYTIDELLPQSFGPDNILTRQK